MKKGFSILFSFILLVSHIYLTTGTHYCGGKAVESKILFGETHLGCGSMEMEEPCDVSEKTDYKGVSFEKVPCCENKYHIFQTTDEFVKDVASKSLHVDFTVAFIYTTLNPDLFPKSTHQFYTDYIPPPLEKDIQVLFQTFLI